LVEQDLKQWQKDSADWVAYNDERLPGEAGLFYKGSACSVNRPTILLGCRWHETSCVNGEAMQWKLALLIDHSDRCHNQQRKVGRLVVVHKQPIHDT